MTGDYNPECDDYDYYYDYYSDCYNYFEYVLPNAPIMVWNENYYIETVSDDYGWWQVEVPANQNYYVSGGDIEGFYESTYDMIYACSDYYYDYYYDYDDYCYDYCYYDDYGYQYCYEICYEDYDYCDNQVNINFTPNTAIWFDVQGQVADASGNPLSDIQLTFHHQDTGESHYTWTDYMGYFSISVSYGMYLSLIHI